MGTTSSGISYQLRDIYSICMYYWNVACKNIQFYFQRYTNLLKEEEDM